MDETTRDRNAFLSLTRDRNGLELMKISFDLDDTLVCYAPTVPREVNRVPRVLRWWFRDPLRQGTVGLIQELQNRGHEITIYTTSSRSPCAVRWWLRCYGIRIRQVVNQEIHQRTISRLSLCNPPTKYPPAFNIDFHVDDLPGVAVEGQRHGFEVLVIDPHDQDWTRHILNAVDKMSPDCEATLS